MSHLEDSYAAEVASDLGVSAAMIALSLRRDTLDSPDSHRVTVRSDTPRAAPSSVGVTSAFSRSRRSADGLMAPLSPCLMEPEHTHRPGGTSSKIYGQPSDIFIDTGRAMVYRSDPACHGHTVMAHRQTTTRDLGCLLMILAFMASFVVPPGLYGLAWVLVGVGLIVTVLGIVRK